MSEQVLDHNPVAVVEAPVETGRVEDMHKAEIGAYAADVAMSEALGLKADTKIKQAELRSTKEDLAQRPDSSVPAATVKETDKLLEEVAHGLERQISSQNNEEESLRKLAVRDSDHAELRYDQGKEELPHESYGRTAPHVTLEQAAGNRESAVERDLKDSSLSISVRTENSESKHSQEGSLKKLLKRVTHRSKN